TETMAVVCECGELACTEQVELDVPTYERVRSDAAHFVVLPGHEIPDVEESVEEHGTFNIIRKDPGGPAELARDLDERRQSSNRNEARRAGAIGARSARTQGAPIVNYRRDRGR